MGKYETLAKDIVKNVGGKENVTGLVHCITRLRFTLKDESIAKDDVLKKMDGVVTVMKSGFYPFPRIYPAWIYPCDDHTYPGYYRFAFDGTEKRRRFRIPFWIDKFY